MNKRLAVAFGLIVALITSSIAWAAANEPNALLTEGYDSDNHNLVWGVAQHPEAEDSTAVFDCRVAGTYTYEFDEGGKVVTLTGEGGAAMYQPVDETADPVPYGATGEECVLTVTGVEGPNGQVNHGSIVSSFVHALKDAGIRGGVGCYVRLIAQSGYGKGDQQVQVGEVVPPTGTVISGEVTLATHETTCGNKHADEEVESAGTSRDNNGNGNGHGNNGHGKPAWAGQGGGRP
jgi:hypothetical protein